MQRNPSSEATNHSASQEIPHLLRNPKVYYRLHKNLLQVPVLSQMHPVHSLSHYFLRSILILSSVYVSVIQVVLSLQVFLPKYHMHLSSLPVCYMPCPS